MVPSDIPDTLHGSFFDKNYIQGTHLYTHIWYSVIYIPDKCSNTGLSNSKLAPANPTTILCGICTC